MRAGGGDGQSGGDQAVPGLDDPRVAVGGARLHDHHGLPGPGHRVDQLGPGLGGQLLEHVADGDQVRRGQLQRRADPGPLPARLPQPRHPGRPGQFAAQGQGGLGPVQDGRRRPLPGPGHRPARRARAAADVGVGGGRPVGRGLDEGVEGGAYGLEGGGHPVRGVRDDIGTVPQDRGVRRGLPSVAGDQPVDGLRGLLRRQPVEQPGQGGAQGLGGGEGDVHRRIVGGGGGADAFLCGGAGGPLPGSRNPYGTGFP